MTFSLNWEQIWLNLILKTCHALALYQGAPPLQPERILHQVIALGLKASYSTSLSHTCGRKIIVPLSGEWQELSEIIHRQHFSVWLILRTHSRQQIRMNRGHTGTSWKESRRCQVDPKKPEAEKTHCIVSFMGGSRRGRTTWWSEQWITLGVLTRETHA